jgi:hypothetical protein
MPMRHPRFVSEAQKGKELPVTSSLLSEDPAEQHELFRDVLEALEGSRISYAVSGAFALQQHTGICRSTQDLDLFLTAKTLDAPVAVPAASRTRMRGDGSGMSGEGRGVTDFLSTSSRA